MKPTAFTATLFIFLLMNSGASAQVLQTLSGLVTAVDAESNQLHVLFEHPVTGEELVKIFTIRPDTGFKNVKRLRDIKPRDPVSIDYEEIGVDTLRAVYVEVVSIDKVPFTKEQIDKAFS